jgi:mannose-6-phosphate isomerase
MPTPELRHHVGIATDESPCGVEARQGRWYTTIAHTVALFAFDQRRGDAQLPERRGREDGDDLGVTCPDRGSAAVSTTPAGPLTLLPKVDAKPWGGRRLAEWGVALPAEERIGEALLTAPESTVASGELAGTPLGELVQHAPEAWIGARGLEATGGRELFPLLIKLIDAQANLSIQVHPDDRAAAAAGLGTGKTEAYHILAADPGSVLYLGLVAEASREAFSTACLRADGAAARFLRQVEISPGMTILIPAGTAHAPGAGMLIYEIQQPSNVTYRLDDWGRVDAKGQPRALHHAEGMPLVNAASRPEPISAIQLAHGRTLLVATRYFALEQITLVEGERVLLDAVESPQVFTCVAGTVRIFNPDPSTSLKKGETAIVPVGLPILLTSGEDTVVLRAWVPDLPRDVIEPARAASTPESALRQLGLSAG